MSKPSVHTQTLSDLLLLLKVKSEHVENMDRPHLTDTRAMLPKNFTDLSVYSENVQTADIETHQIDKFSPLSIVQIDGEICGLEELCTYVSILSYKSFFSQFV